MIILVIVLIGMQVITNLQVTKQEQKIAKIEEPLKMQESITQTANLAQARTMAVAAADNNKYPTLAEVKTLLNSQMLSMYPVGAIYMSTNSTNPGSLFGGTWVAWGTGRVPVGINTGDGNFNTVEKTGGEASHKLTLAEIPSHTHSIPALSGSTNSAGSHSHTSSIGGSFYTTRGSSYYELQGLTGGGAFSEEGGGVRRTPNTNSTGEHTHTVTTNASTTGGSGSTGTHNNLQPYITCYMWKRTA